MKGKLWLRDNMHMSCSERERERFLLGKHRVERDKQIRNSWDTIASSVWYRGGKVINCPRVRNYIRLGGCPRTISFPGEAAISQREISPLLADHWPSRADRYILYLLIIFELAGCYSDPLMPTYKWKFASRTRDVQSQYPETQIAPMPDIG